MEIALPRALISWTEDQYKHELTGVPLVKNSPRAPLGPSDVLIDGMPFSGMATVRQKSAPASSEIWNGQLDSIPRLLRLLK